MRPPLRGLGQERWVLDGWWNLYTLWEILRAGKGWKTLENSSWATNGIVPRYLATVSSARSSIHYRFPSSWCSEFQPTLFVQNSTKSTTISRGRDWFLQRPCTANLSYQGWGWLEKFIHMNAHLNYMINAHTIGPKMLLEDTDDGNHESYNLENLLFSVRFLLIVNGMCSAELRALFSFSLEEDMTITFAPKATEN